MSLTGAYLTVLIGTTIPLPAPPTLMRAIERVQVTHNDSARSGFRITFAMGRTGATSLTDYPLFISTLLQPFNRVILSLTFRASVHVLMDGIITQHDFLPSNEPGASSLLVTGEDVSVMMDLTQRKVLSPALADPLIVTEIIGRYTQYGLVPQVSPAPVNSQPPIRQRPFQDATDLAYMLKLAERFGYVFYIIPGPLPGANQAYSGPHIRTGVPQPALSVDLGPTTNVEQMHFTYGALTPVTVVGGVQDRVTNQIQRIRVDAATGPVLSARLGLASQRRVREVQLGRTSGLTYTQALALAQGRVTGASNQTVVAEGQMDTLRYGAILEARRLVGVRGAGDRYDGTYYVKSVTHDLAVGSARQSFTLLRQGIGAATGRVRP